MLYKCTIYDLFINVYAYIFFGFENIIKDQITRLWMFERTFVHNFERSVPERSEKLALSNGACFISFNLVAQKRRNFTNKLKRSKYISKWSVPLILSLYKEIQLYCFIRQTDPWYAAVGPPAQWTCVNKPKKPISQHTWIQALCQSSGSHLQLTNRHVLLHFTPNQCISM